MIAQEPIGLSLRNTESVETEIVGNILFNCLSEIETGRLIVAENTGIDKSKRMGVRTLQMELFK
jgi:hypothetical protein